MSYRKNLQSETVEIDFPCPAILSDPLCKIQSELDTITQGIVGLTNEIADPFFNAIMDLQRREINFFGQTGTSLSGIWDNFINLINDELRKIDTQAKTLAKTIVSKVESEIDLIKTPLIIFLVIVIIVLLFLLLIVIRLYFPRLFGA